MRPKVCMNTEIFVEFFCHFARFKPWDPLLIFVGAKYHFDYNICDFAEDNAIFLYFLPLIITHELQPLEKRCFRSFEIFWNQHSLLNFTAYKEEQDVSKLNFTDVFTPTFEKSMTQANIKSGFTTTGTFPFNPLILPKEAFKLSPLSELTPPESNAIQSISPVNLQLKENDLIPEPNSSSYQTNIR